MIPCQRIQTQSMHESVYVEQKIRCIRTRTVDSGRTVSHLEGQQEAPSVLGVLLLHKLIMHVCSVRESSASCAKKTFSATLQLGLTCK